MGGHLCAGVILFFVGICNAQHFDPKVKDLEYLDMIENRLGNESMTAQETVVNQAKILQEVTRAFIGTKLKENLFKMVRERVEVELEEMSKNMTERNRQPRQDEEDDDDAKPVTSNPRPGLLPQLANVVTTLFGSNVNVTGYVREATQFLPPDLSSRIVTAVNLIDPARFTSTTTPPPVIINGQIIPNAVLINGSQLAQLPQIPVSPQGQAAQQQTVYQVPRVPNPAQAQPIPQSSVVQSPQTVVPPAGNPEPLRNIPAPVTQQPALVPDYKVNTALGVPASRPPAEEEDYKRPEDEDSGEDDVIARDDLALTTVGYLDEFVVVKYAFNLFNKIAGPTMIPTTTDPPFEETEAPPSTTTPVPTSTAAATTTVETATAETAAAKNSTEKIDYIDEDESSTKKIPVTTPLSSIQRVIRGGQVLFQGAKEAYSFLQQINSYLDKIGNRLENAGYGPSDVGIDLQTAQAQAAETSQEE